MLSCNIFSPLLFSVSYLSPPLSLLFPRLLLNLVLLHCEVVPAAAALATTHKSRSGILALFLLQSVYLLFASIPESKTRKKNFCCY